MVILDAALQVTEELKTVSDSLNLGITIIGSMASVILLLIAWIWNNTNKNHNNTEVKVDKLTDQVTRLATLMEVALPEIKDNTKQINELQVNCATQNHSKRRSA